MNYDSELYCIGRGLPPDEGGLHQTTRGTSARGGEDYPQMKGDYTGNRAERSYDRGEDYPQMKGDYTCGTRITGASPERITPR